MQLNFAVSKLIIINRMQICFQNDAFCCKRWLEANICSCQAKWFPREKISDSTI